MEDNHRLRDSVTRYVDALKVAQTDGEKFAALLVVAQIEKSLKLTPSERRAVYGSLDLTFINRLLNANNEPEGCEKGTFMSLGLTILSCMINETEKVNESQNFLDFIPRLIAIIYELDGNDGSGDQSKGSFREDIFENCFNILMIIASNEDGCKRVLQGLSSHSQKTLSKEKTIKILPIIVSCVAFLKGDTLVSFKEPLKDILSQSACFFASSNDQDKFTLLALILEFINTNTEKGMFYDATDMFLTEQKFLRKGLLDILQSKVDKKFRHMSLKLASELIEVFGMNWTCMTYQNEEEKYSKKFLHLVVSLTSVEVKMLFYEKSDDIVLMSYLFAILETSIQAISSNEDSIVDIHLGENMASKILQAISGAAREVLCFIDDVKDSLQLTDACRDLKVIACVRLLCAYMSEETQALEKEVVKVAPYLIQLGKTSFHIHKDELLSYVTSKDEKFQPAVIFMFLLPVLCHWSADDTTRAMIIKSDLHSTLWEFLCMLVTHQGKHALETTETLTGIFTNIAITEPKLASNPSTIFGPMVQLIVQKLCDYLKGNVQLLMSLVTLGLILSRAQLYHKSKVDDSIVTFFRQCLACFYNTCPFLQCKDYYQMQNWPQTSELWFVGFDNIIACVAGSKQLRELLNGDPVTVQMRQFVERNKASESSDVKQICDIVKHLILALNKGP